MTKTFLLIRKEPLKIEAYTSLSALCEAHNKELGVSKFTLDRIDFSFDRYENDKIIIEQTYAKSTGDVRKEKEKFI